MSRDPAFLFYSSDFLTGTMMMTKRQVGCYIILLCLQHQKGHLTKKDILFVCEEEDEAILEKFKEDENGKYYNKRLEEEAEKRSKYTESRRRNLNKKSADIDSHMDTHTDSHMTTHKDVYMKSRKAVRMENENENENIDRDSIKNSTKDSNNLLLTFEDFQKMRVEKKKPMSDRAKEMMLKKLGKLSSEIPVQIAILQKSILNNWTDVYPLKPEDEYLIEREQKPLLDPPPYTPGLYGVNLDEGV